MEVTTEQRDFALIARAAGRIDGFNAQDFEATLHAAARDFEGPLIIDCEELSYVSSAGLRAMLLIAKSLNEKNVKFALCSLPPTIAEIFQISGFDQIISTHPSQPEALAAVSP